MHVITGLPRSGSTLLCNVLNQNPEFHASSTSRLPIVLNNMIAQIGAAPEIRGDLVLSREETEARIKRSLQAFGNAWYSHIEKIIFDKSRAWVHNLLALRELYPQAKVIVTIRDLREIFASIEKQYRKNPLLDDTSNPNAKDILVRANEMFSPKGMVGHCLRGIQNILQRRLDVFWWKFEDFAANPEQHTRELYTYLDESYFNHNFEEIESTATDVDALYLFKFPHVADGPVRPPVKTWPKFMSTEFADGVLATSPWYNKRFGYIKSVN